MPKFLIAGLMIEIDAPCWVIHKNLESFLCDGGKADIRCKVVFEKHPDLPISESKPIVKGFIYDVVNEIHSLAGCEDDIPAYTISSSDWSKHTMYIDPKYNDPQNSNTAFCVREGVFVHLRNAMIAVLAKNMGLIIHSCSIIWQGKGILFSAPSGTGKSTHAHMWKERYHVQILDGDTTACRIVDGVPIIYGLPWCGTSNEYINGSVPLAAIVFLQQAPKNSIEKLDTIEAFMRLTERCIMLRWSEPLTSESLETLQFIAENTDCYLLKCLPDFNAVELVRKSLKKQAPGSKWASEILPILNEGLSMKIPISGSSMYPFLVGERDEVVIASVSGMKLKRGDIVLYIRNDGTHILHRIHHIEGDLYYMMGDAQASAEGPVCAEDILAVVTALVRKQKTIPCKRMDYLILSRVWSILTPLRPLIIKSWLKYRKWCKGRNHKSIS